MSTYEHAVVVSAGRSETWEIAGKLDAAFAAGKVRANCWVLAGKGKTIRIDLHWPQDAKKVRDIVRPYLKNPMVADEFFNDLIEDH